LFVTVSVNVERRSGVPDTRAFRVVGWEAGSRAELHAIRSKTDLMDEIAVRRFGAQRQDK
jgi:hypothetical protein